MKKLLGAAAAAAALIIPGISFAADFAYVDANGEVRTTTAATPNEAILTAPNIDEHSGVLLLDSSDDDAVVGDSVSGV